MLLRQPDALDLRHLVTEIGRLPPAQIGRLDFEIASAADLTRYHTYERTPVMTLVQRLLASIRSPEMAPFILRLGVYAGLLEYRPDVAYLFIFHRDGVLRERALDMIQEGLRSAFYVATLAYRLNDWVPQVRSAAVRCADRVLPLTDAAIIAEAATSLYARRLSWQRWGDEAAALDRALSRDDVSAKLADLLRQARDGPMGTVLKHAIRWETMDRHLDALSTGAFLPQVRAVALQTLVSGVARWPVGRAKEWIDRVYNQFRWVRVYNERPVIRPHTPEILIERGALDHSGAVRKVAATALVNLYATLQNCDRIVALLASDRSSAIRERIDYVRRASRQGQIEN